MSGFVSRVVQKIASGLLHTVGISSSDMSDRPRVPDAAFCGRRGSSTASAPEQDRLLQDFTRNDNRTSIKEASPDCLDDLVSGSNSILQFSQSTTPRNNTQSRPPLR